MVLRLVYRMFSKVLGWMALCTRSDTTKEIEILVLRHQLAVLRRGSPRPRINGTDRALIGRASRGPGVRVRDQSRGGVSVVPDSALTRRVGTTGFEPATP
jgi:hypothetical protein